MSIKTSNFVSSLNRRKFKNNTQRVLHTLLTADGEWVPRTTFRVPSSGSRLRDLRKDRFGGFKVQCKSAASLGMVGGQHTFYYRLPVSGVTLTRLQSIFEGVI